MATLLAGVSGAHAQSVDAVGAAQRALNEALQEAPLSLSVVLFVKDKAAGYGMYEARDSSHFKVGEPLMFFIEPLGYKYKSTGDMVTFGLSMDLVLTRKGDVLFSKDDFLNVDFQSHHANTELMLNGTLNVSGAPAGDYQIELVVRDHSSAQTARTQLPFTID